MDRKTILAKVVAGEITLEAADKMLASRAQAATAKALSFKVGQKGGVSVYGLNSRFPITLYASQWERLLAVKDELVQFLQDHAAELATKDDAKRDTLPLAA